MPNKDIYRDACLEIVEICKLLPDWNLQRWLLEEDLDVTKGHILYNGLKEYRERLELDSNVLCVDADLAKIMEDGLRIYNIIIEDQLYGYEED